MFLLSQDPELGESIAMFMVQEKEDLIIDMCIWERHDTGHRVQSDSEQIKTYVIYNLSLRKASNVV